MPGAVIIGAGPGIGRSVARRFAREGLPVALVARSERTLTAAAEALSPTGVPIRTLAADSTDEPALRAALDAATEKFGLPDAVVYNAAIIQSDSLGELSVSAHLDGPVAPGTDFDPDVIAEHYWRLHTQPRHAWEREVLHTGR